MADGLVLDASVVINVLGSGAAARVLQAISGRRVVPDVTSREILRDPLAPAGGVNPLDALVTAGLIERVGLTPATMETFIELVGAAPPIDLFALPSVAAALGEALADAVFSALIHARMRVLPENDAWVRLLLGERAELCPSLKKRRR